MKTTKIGLVWIGLLIVMAFVILLFSRCTSTKDIQKTDNTREKVLEDSLRLVISERDRYEAELIQAQYAEVLFDTITSHDTITNVVTITKEGEIKATGKITSAFISKNFYQRIISEKDKLIDSLRSVKNREIVKTVTITKHKKTTFITWWIWLIIVGAVLFNFRKQLKFI